MKPLNIIVGLFIAICCYVAYQFAAPNEYLCRAKVLTKTNVTSTIAEVKDSKIAFRFKIQDRSHQSVVLNSINIFGDSITQDSRNEYIRSVRSSTDNYIKFYQYDSRDKTTYYMECPKS